MGDHYSDVRNTIYRQQKEAQRKAIKSKINRLNDDDLQLLDEFLDDLEMFKSFFCAVKRISKMDV